MAMLLVVLAIILVKNVILAIVIAPVLNVIVLEMNFVYLMTQEILVLELVHAWLKRMMMVLTNNV